MYRVFKFHNGQEAGIVKSFANGKRAQDYLKNMANIHREAKSFERVVLTDSYLSLQSPLTSNNILYAIYAI